MALHLTTREFVDYVAATQEVQVVFSSEGKKLSDSKHHKVFWKAG